MTEHLSDFAHAHPLGSIKRILVEETGLDTDDALAAITARAAHSLRLEDRGTLDVGAAADLAVFAVADRTAILYHFGINHCRTVIKNGQVVMRDGTRA